jgi:hypothetical protein
MLYGIGDVVELKVQTTQGFYLLHATVVNAQFDKLIIKPFNPKEGKMIYLKVWGKKELGIWQGQCERIIKVKGKDKMELQPIQVVSIEILALKIHSKVLNNPAFVMAK